MRLFNVHNVAQRTPEWAALRVAKLTGSCAGDAVSQPNARSSGSPELGEGVKESEKRRTLRNKLAVERLCGKSFDQSFSTKWTRDGIEREPFALAEFENARNECVFTTGFLSHVQLKAGHSPDGYCGDFEDIIEAKCFDWERHLDALTSAKLEAKIEAQIIHGMWITNAKRGHVVFFHPEFPPSLRLKIVTLKRKDEDVKEALDVYAGRAELFLEDVDKTVDYLRSLGAQTEAESVA